MEQETSLTLAERYPQYDIGRWSYGSPEILTWDEGAMLRIGAFCSIANGVSIMLGGEHRPDWVTTYPFSVLWVHGRAFAGHPVSKGDVSIGNDVWIGREALILSGVRIGDGAVIGARAVVAGDVEPYAIVAGNPARVIRYRFSPSVISRLLGLCWWNWADDKIERLLPLMLSSDIESFLAVAEKEDQEGAVGK
jgi:acetyltransferase-like isoleucine patch superfamily enzyme